MIAVVAAVIAAPFVAQYLYLKPRFDRVIGKLDGMIDKGIS